MSTYTIIGTWRMSYEGIVEGSKLLTAGGTASDAVELAIKITENEPLYKSVGFGGLPNYDGLLQLDAAWMCGDTLAVGCATAVQDIANPISLARRLSKERFNCFLTGDGAEAFASREGLEKKNMLTERALKTWQNRLKEVMENEISPYDGHDTVGIAALDIHGSIAVGVSTSGLFMKRHGRVGDSALPGCGFYADSSFGAAAATGLGEDLMKRPLSYEIVAALQRGRNISNCMDEALFSFEDYLRQKYGKAGAMSLVGIDSKGGWNITTNCEFSFAVASSSLSPTVFIANKENQQTVYAPASQEWMDAYATRIRKPIP
ncbi:MAG: isoaspartyl peptidase/L-asparaginase [Brevinema sp.]